MTSPRRKKQELNSIANFLQQRLTQIESIRYLNHAHPLFKQWDRENRKFLIENLGRAYLDRYRLISFSSISQRDGFLVQPSASWRDKDDYQKGLQRARIFLKSILWELREKDNK